MSHMSSDRLVVKILMKFHMCVEIYSECVILGWVKVF